MSFIEMFITWFCFISCIVLFFLVAGCVEKIKELEDRLKIHERLIEECWEYFKKELLLSPSVRPTTSACDDSNE